MAALQLRRSGTRPAVYEVAGGNHVTILLSREETDARVDAIDVLAHPGGGPPPHRHAFAEWFRRKLTRRGPPR